MYCSKKLSEQHEIYAEKHFVDMYPLVIAEYRESIRATNKMGRHYWDNIWQEKSPRSNVYRYNGLQNMHRHISRDLMQQLLVLADKHQHIFNQYTKDNQERADKLIEALQRVQAQNSPEWLDDGEKPLTGFLPLQEFLNSPAEVWFRTPFGGEILVPSDEEECSLYLKNLAMAIVVFLLQVIAPLTMLMNHWIQKENYIRTPQLASQLFSAQEIGCLGSSQVPRTMTVVGTLLLIIVNFIVRTEVLSELEDNIRSGRALNSPFWYCIGVIANAWSCFVLVLVLPLIFWSLNDVVSMVCDSMGVLFIYGLDDLTDVVFSYLDISDDNYKRSAAWTSILLTRCPLVLADVVNPNATSIDEFWSIKFDDHGFLLSVDNKRSLVRMDDHFMESERHENDSLFYAPGDLVYRNTGVHMRLPSTLNRYGASLWRVLSNALLVLQFTLPVIFFVFNDACAFQALHMSVAQAAASVWGQPTSAWHSATATRTGVAPAWNHTAASLHVHP